MSESDLDILQGLTVQSVRDRLFRKVYGRAEAYYRERRVHSPRRTGAMLEAYVRGTELYAVRIEAADGSVRASCTCPFVQTAVCKHIGAVLLQWIREPDSFAITERGEELPPALDAIELFPAQTPSPLSAFPSDYEQPTAVRGGGTGREETQSNLPALLEQQKLAQLREIARQRSWRIKGNTKADYVAALAPLLGNPTEVARAVTSLPDELREALRAAFVAEDGYAITPVALARVVTALRGEQGPPLKPVEGAGLLLDLARWGLVMPWHNFSNGLCYLFPWEVQSHVPPLPGWCRQSPQAPPGQVLSRKKRDSVQLFYAVWEHISRQPPRLRPAPEPLTERRLVTALRDWPYDPHQIQERLTGGSGWGRQISRKLSVPPLEPLIDDEGQAALAPLTGDDMEQLDFVCRLLREANLLSHENGYLVSRPDAMARFLRNSASEQHALMSKAYTSMLDWSELDMLLRRTAGLTLERNVGFPFSYAQFRSELVSLRQMVLRFLATAGEEGWCTLGEVEVALRAVRPDFFSTLEASGPRWLQAALGWSWRQQQPEVHADGTLLWQATQGGFLRVVLNGPLHWLGLTELCLQDAELLAFRLRGLADLIWDRPVAPAQDEPPGESVVVDEARLTISVHPSSVPPQVHTLLGRIARLETAKPGRFIYCLDLRTAHAAFERGESPVDILAEWEQVMPLPIPGSVQETLCDWWSRYGQVRLYQGLALLELGDLVTLRELEASTSLSQHILARLTPRLVVLPDKAVDALLEEFTAKGYMPKEMR